MQAGKVAARKPRLVTFGCNVSGALGRGEIGKGDLIKAEVVPTPLDDAPVQVSAGWGHTAFVTEKGNLVMSGRAFDMRNVLRFGKLARDRPRLAYAWTRYFGASGSIDFTEPTMLNRAAANYVKVSCSAALTIAIAGDGKAWALGANRYGQIGMADTSSDTPVFEPTMVKFPDNTPKLLDLATGYQHVLALDEDGDIYTWGKGDKGQLGWGEDALKSSPVRLPRKLPKVDENGVKAVSCGFAHAVALSRSGRVYTWGKGLDKGRADILKPKMVEGLPPIQEIASGQYHNIAKGFDGNFYQWGLLPSEMGGEYVDSPRLISGIPKTASNLVCGINESCAIHEGVPYVWTWKDPRPRPLEALASFHVLQLSLGWRHTAAIVA